MPPPIALTIAGSDPSGGAGIQADLKTFHQFGVYGQAVISLLTVQNTQGVSRVEIMSGQFVSDQIDAVVRDIPPAAAKTGAMGNEDVILAVATAAESFPFPLVIDPVMVSKHGARLLSPSAEEALRMRLLPRAYLVTPNIPEAEAILGRLIEDESGMITCAESLLSFGCEAALVKGGHLPGPPTDILAFGSTILRIPGTRVDTRHTHGTGCTYSAAIVAALAAGDPLVKAVRRAKQYVQAAIEGAPGLGSGHGPINHFADPGLDKLT